MQFHPESIASEYGHNIIANFLKNMITSKFIFKFIGFIIIFIAQSCADFSIDVPEIDNFKNIESFKNKASSEKNNQKTKKYKYKKANRS